MKSNTIKGLITGAIFVLTLPAIIAFVAVPEWRVHTATQAVLEQMDSKEATTFTNVQVGTAGRVCGMVHGINRTGGYTGSALFIYDANNSTTTFVQNEMKSGLSKEEFQRVFNQRAEFVAAYNNFCGK